MIANEHYVKVFTYEERTFNKLDSLESQINDYLEVTNDKLIDVKYSTSYDNTLFKVKYSALVILKKVGNI